MAKKEDKEEKMRVGKMERRKRLQDQLGRHLSESKDKFQTLRDGFEDKEAMLVCALEDDISKDDDRKSQVFDPRLSTIVFERAARVMAQNPKGKAYPVSSNDVGKSKFMNLLLDYYTANANTWHSMIVKLRIMDIYSMVYGSMFALVPWTVNRRSNYVGPDFIPLPIRSCYPQPGATSIKDSDWFQVSSMKGLDWLKKQRGKKGWIDENINMVISQVQGNKQKGEVEGDVKEDYQRSYVEKEWYPESGGDSAFPKIWLQTEYRLNDWYVFAPKYGNLLLRESRNPYNNQELPIVAKNAFPLMDSIIGLGEFERGKTLQLAINSLINLYLDGVKYSIFPPIHVDPNSVIQSTIQWGPGSKWLMKNPGRDVKHMRLSPLGLQTFQSTYGFMVSALLNAKEGSRDEWDRIMMEDTIKDVYSKWVSMIIAKQNKKVSVRLFGDEAKKLAEDHPDIVGYFSDAGYGVANIGKEQLSKKYDFILESGTTLKKDPDAEKNDLIDLFGMLIKSPQTLQMIQQSGKNVDMGELFKRIVGSTIKDVDKVVTDATPGRGAAPGQPPPEMGNFEDEDITRAGQQIQGMMGGIPVK
jgi:hypothetical protein